MCYSPISLYATLCIASEISQNNTQKEILDSLSLRNVEEVEKTYGKIREIKDCGIKDWIFSNRLLVDNSLLREDADKKVTRLNSIYECYPGTYDPLNQNTSTKLIEEKMGEKIFDSSDFAENADCYITNVVYYESDWVGSVRKVNNQDFYLSPIENPEEKVNTEYMYSEKNGYCINGKDYIATVEYLVGGSEMWFILPYEDKELKDIQKEEAINEIIASINNEDTYLMK